jgi:adenine-specific DNA-methyltransferase
MNDAYFGNSTFSINQRRYLGSKTKLLFFIDEIIQKENITFETFADIFAGTATVANHFYDNCKIIVNDILQSNNYIYWAFFAKDKIDQKKLNALLDFYNTIDIEKYDGNYFSQNFSNTYFDEKNAKQIGIIRQDIEDLFDRNIITFREKAYLITSLIYALDKIANTVGHYDAYRKVNIENKKLCLLPLNIKLSKYTPQIYCQDANELIKKIESDIVYIDPPYNSRQYCDAYHLLENIAGWKKEKVFGIAKKMERGHLKSKYNMKSAGLAFGDLIDNIRAKYILISYNDMGISGNLRSQARISDYEILSALKQKGEVKVFETAFKQFTTGKSSKKDLKERIFLCKVSFAAKERLIFSFKLNPMASGFVKSPLNYTGGKHKLLPQIIKFFPQNIDIFYDVFCGGANVGINVEAKKIICLEKNKYVVNLLKLIQKNNFEYLHKRILNIIKDFGLSQSFIKGYGFYGANSSNGLGQFNKTAFLKLRDAFNNDKSKLDLLLTLIIYSFNNQIRFNAQGDFNLPVGKRDYNGSLRKNLISFNQAANEKSISFKVCDFRELEKIKISQKDFIYLDPPYLLGLASYNELGAWKETDEKDLYCLLAKLNKKGIRFALSNVLKHKGKTNEILYKWIKENDFIIHKLNYDYKNSSYHLRTKNDETIEVLITNY